MILKQRICLQTELVGTATRPRVWKQRRLRCVQVSQQDANPTTEEKKKSCRYFCIMSTGGSCVYPGVLTGSDLTGQTTEIYSLNSLRSVLKSSKQNCFQPSLNQPNVSCGLSPRWRNVPSGPSFKEVFRAAPPPLRSPSPGVVVNKRSVGLFQMDVAPLNCFQPGLIFILSSRLMTHVERLSC